ncbi:hypothetical protein QJS10_CPB19g01522 [Acorus calamus]|uniref:PWWP domain-containing protein n=1 Tax=Acorus calamus TaxID=4465 RepID=A0AAV9CFX2_ACOCL|nr:hypothetical protein QJS10_CPB19g01522 [Acorus calamus]
MHLHIQILLTFKSHRRDIGLSLLAMWRHPNSLRRLVRTPDGRLVPRGPASRLPRTSIDDPIILDTDILEETMQKQHLRRTEKCANIDGGEDTNSGSCHLNHNIMLGDLLWVRISDCSWWPAQIMNTDISGNDKSNKNIEGKAMVRLYGSYHYLFVDPENCRSEFENVLKENNCSYKLILEKALEKETSLIEPDAIEKGEFSGSNGLEVASQHVRKLKTSHKAVPVSAGVVVRKSHDTIVQLTRATKKAINEASMLKEPKQDVNRRTREGSDSGIKVYIRRSPRVRTQQMDLEQTHNFSQKVYIRRSPRVRTQQMDLEQKVNSGFPNIKTPRKKGNISCGAVEPNSAGTSIGKSSALKKASEGASKDRTVMLGGCKQNKKTSEPCSVISLEKSQDHSARQMRVMRGLALAAPIGSPFHRNGFVSQVK